MNRHVSARIKRTLISFGCAALLTGCVVMANSGNYDIGEPGFSGAIDIYGAPPPVLLYPQPIAVGAVAAGAGPLYLYVPLERAQRWGDYCVYYNACNRAVYFVDPGWYERQYVPYYRSHANDFQQRRTGVEHYRPGPQHGETHRSDPPAPPLPRPDEHRPPVHEERQTPPPAPVPARQERRDVAPAPRAIDSPAPHSIAPPVRQEQHSPAPAAHPPASEKKGNERKDKGKDEHTDQRHG